MGRDAWEVLQSAVLLMERVGTLAEEVGRVYEENHRLRQEQQDLRDRLVRLEAILDEAARTG